MFCICGGMEECFVFVEECFVFVEEWRNVLYLWRNGGIFCICGGMFCICGGMFYICGGMEVCFLIVEEWRNVLYLWRNVLQLRRNFLYLLKYILLQNIYFIYILCTCAHSISCFGCIVWKCLQAKCLRTPRIPSSPKMTRKILLSQKMRIVLKRIQKQFFDHLKFLRLTIFSF